MSGLHILRRGSGPPVLLIPGARAGLEHWGERFLTALSGGCEVLAYDPPGVGSALDRKGRRTMSELADDAARVIDAAGCEVVAAFGVSLGGVVAQELALRHPGCVNRLIVGGGNAGGAAAGPRTAALGRRFADALADRDRTSATKTLFRLCVKDPTDSSAREEHQHAEDTVVSDGAEVLGQLEEYSRHSTLDRLPRLRTATLILHGEADRVIDLEDAVTLARTLPAATLRVLPVGHFLWLEAPDVVADAIATFCSGRPQAVGAHGGLG